MKGRIFAAVMTILIVISCVQAFHFYNQNLYPAVKANDYMSLASQTDNLTDMANYLEQAYIIMQNYHGNPAWPFPTPANDYDLISANILSTRQAALTLSHDSNVTSFAYQQGVQNLIKVTDELYADIASANQFYWLNPYLNPIGVMITFLYFAVPAAIILGLPFDFPYHEDYSDWKSTRPKEVRERERRANEKYQETQRASELESLWLLRDLDTMKGNACRRCNGIGKIRPDGWAWPFGTFDIVGGKDPYEEDVECPDCHGVKVMQKPS